MKDIKKQNTFELLQRTPGLLLKAFIGTFVSSLYYMVIHDSIKDFVQKGG